METKTLIRNIALIVGIAAVAFSGLFFILFVDLYLKGDSVELFLGILLPLASIVCFVLSESFKHSAWKFFLLKILAYMFALGFIIYAFVFMSQPTFTETRTCLKLIKTFEGKKVFFLDAVKFNDGIDIPFDKQPPYIIMVVASIVGCIAQILNTIMNKLVGLD